MSNVYAVILAGGSGTRFWPASRRAKPKQLLPLGPGTGTLLAQTVERLSPLCDPERILIATGVSVLEATQAALPNLPDSAFLGEPIARNTAPCIGWATERIARDDPDALVVVVPSDQYIERHDAYIAALQAALSSAKQGVITTLGIRPTRAETGYGYVEAEDEVQPGVFSVKRFVEKPDLATAREYLAAGNYYWNAGMFIFSAASMLQQMQRSMPELYQGLMEIRQAAAKGQEREAVERVFLATEKISIDYGVMERAERLNVVPADIGWSDLGSFQVAWELSDKDPEDNVAPPGSVLIDSRDNLLLDLRSAAPQGADASMALVGVSGMCVVQTDTALLVIPRERCQEVKRIVEELERTGRTDLL